MPFLSVSGDLVIRFHDVGQGVYAIVALISVDMCGSNPRHIWRLNADAVYEDFTDSPCSFR